MTDITFASVWQECKEQIPTWTAEEIGRHFYDQAQARLREPQTADTCQHVPPHRKAYLVEQDMGHVGADGPEWKMVEGAPTLKPVCLICETEKQGRQEALKPPPIVSRWNV